MTGEATSRSKLPFLGFGLRLRKEYIDAVLQDHPDVEWFEIISESFLDQGEEELQALERIRGHYPLVMHGLSMAIGSPWPLDQAYLKKLKVMIDRIQPEWVSDHLCWSGADDVQGSLLPLPYSSEMLEHLVARIDQVQESLGRPILLENVPAECTGCRHEIPEAEFIREVAGRSGSLILIDIENLHSSSVNQGFDTGEYLSTLPADRVQQIHLLGATALCEPGTDTPQAPDPIWALYLQALTRFGPVSTMVERVDTIPPLEEMVAEAAKARCGASSFLAA